MATRTIVNILSKVPIVTVSSDFTVVYEHAAKTKLKSRVKFVNVHHNSEKNQEKTYSSGEPKWRQI